MFILNIYFTLNLKKIIFGYFLNNDKEKQWVFDYFNFITPYVIVFI